MGKTLYLMSDGELKRKDNTLYIVRDGENPKYLPVETLDEILVFGETTFNKSIRDIQAHIGRSTDFFFNKQKRNTGETP